LKELNEKLDIKVSSVKDNLVLRRRVSTSYNKESKTRSKSRMYNNEVYQLLDVFIARRKVTLECSI